MLRGSQNKMSGYFGGDRKAYENWLKQQEDILALKISSRHWLRGHTFNFIAFLLCGIVLLYWFLPLALDIINEKIIERYELLPVTDFVVNVPVLLRGSGM